MSAEHMNCDCAEKSGAQNVVESEGSTRGATGAPGQHIFIYMRRLERIIVSANINNGTGA